jgi:TetR/AcrR family transcriptional regulator
MDKFEKDGNTEEKILKASRKIFILQGMAGARMQDIADEAGINKAMLHYYFRNKEKLFQTVFEESTKDFFPRIFSIFESDMSLFEKIESFCSEYIAKVVENPFIPLFILNEANKQPDVFLKKMWGKKRPPIEKFSAHVESEIKKGIIKKIDPLHLMMNMMSMCIFPFVAKPIWQNVAGISDKQFKAMMEERKTGIANFIIDSIKK